MSNERTINPNPPADFTPTLGDYKTLQPFRYWCQKVLPLVYDDSLSYYEMLCKVVDYLNKTMEDVETLNGDITGIYSAYSKLQDYVNNYFSSLDVQNEINNKLNEMVADGTLDNIINLKIFSNLNGNGLSFDYEEYKNELLLTILSYMINDVGSACVTGTPTRNTPFISKYNNGNTYMGMFGQGVFNYTDKEMYNGTEYPVFYIDCSGLASLILKNINYVNSPYYIGFNGNTPTIRSANATGNFYEKLFTMDFSNKITTYYIAQICEGCGYPLRQLATSTGNSNVDINSEIINNLRTGDLIFYANSSLTNRYKGVRHCAIYLKDLDEINELARSYNITIQPILYDGDKPEYGYIFHSDGRGTQNSVIKIETLYYRMTPNLDNTTEFTYGCRPFPGVGTSNKFNHVILSMCSNYRDTSLVSLHGNNYLNFVSTYPNRYPTYDNYGLSVYDLISGRGNALNENDDLNNLKNGIYFCDTAAIASTLQNSPWNNTSFYLELKGSLENPDRYGVMMAFVYGEIATAGSPFAFRMRHPAGAWTKWFYPQVE